MINLVFDQYKFKKLEGYSSEDAQFFANHKVDQALNAKEDQTIPRGKYEIYQEDLSPPSARKSLRKLYEEGRDDFILVSGTEPNTLSVYLRKDLI